MCGLPSIPLSFNLAAVLPRWNAYCALLLFTVACLFFPRERLELAAAEEVRLPVGRTLFYLALFLLTVLTVFRILPYYVCLPIVAVSVFLADRNALRRVDYPLLLTFVFFFLLAGNLSRLEIVSGFFTWLLSQNTLLTAILSCQVISNVPSAILLSAFTDNYRALLLGVNIGGVGTLISSLASLITFREYTAHTKGKVLSYLLLFTLINFVFLIILTLSALAMGA